MGRPREGETAGEHGYYVEGMVVVGRRQPSTFVSPAWPPASGALSLLPGRQVRKRRQPIRLSGCVIEV